MFPVRPLLSFGTRRAARAATCPYLRRRKAASPRSRSPSRTPAPISRRSRRRPAATATTSCSRARSATSRTAASPTSRSCSPSSTGRITAFLSRDDPGVAAGRKEVKLGLRASYTGSCSSTTRASRPTGCWASQGRVRRSRWTSSRHRGPRWPRPRWASPAPRSSMRPSTRAGERRSDARSRASQGVCLQARRHGDGDRGGAPARLARVRGGRRGRGRRPARLVREGIRGRRRDAGDDGGGADPRRRRASWATIRSRSGSATRKCFRSSKGRRRSSAS